MHISTPVHLLANWGANFKTRNRHFEAKPNIQLAKSPLFKVVSSDLMV